MDGQLENTFHSFPEHGLTIVKTARVAETKRKECRASIVAVEEGIRLLKTSRSKIGTDDANAPVDLLREAFFVNEDPIAHIILLNKSKEQTGVRTVT